MRLFIALPITKPVEQALGLALVRLESAVAATVPPERWHLTLAFLGEVADAQLVSQMLDHLSLPFLPAVTITHVGRGEQPQQVWAYAAATYPLLALQRMLVERLQQSGLPFPEADFTRPFIPHIRLGNLADSAKQTMLPDEAVQVTFVPKEAKLYVSVGAGENLHYEVQGSMPLTA